MSGGVANRLPLPGGRVDVSGALAILLVAVLLAPLRFLADAVLLEVVPLLLALGSVLYLGAVRYGRENVTHVHLQLRASTAIVLRSLSIVGIAGLVFVAVLSGGRTAPFYVAAVAVAAIVVSQILFVSEEALRPAELLAQILALALVVRFAALLTTSGLVGVDSWTHVTTYAAAIQETGQLEAISEVKYYGAPLYHLLVVVAADAFGTTLRTALYLTLGLAMPLSALFVYAASRYVFPVRWSLFAVAVYALGDHVIRWGIHLIPTSLGLAFFLALFFLVTKLFFTRERLPLYLLALFFGFAIVLTHQVSVFVALSFLGAGVVAQLVDRHFATGRDRAARVGPYGGTVNLAWLFAGLAVITVLNWALTPYQSGTFLTTMLEWLRLVLADSAGFLELAGETPATPAAVEAATITVPDAVEALDSLGFFVLLVAFVLGSLTLLRSEVRSQLSLTYVVATGVMLVFALGIPLFGIQLFLPGRWYAFMYAPMALVGVAGLRYLSLRLPGRTVLVALLVVAVALPGGMLIGHQGTPDSPLFDDHYVEYGYDDAELAGVETVSEIHPETGPTLHTDHPYRTVFARWQGYDAAPFDVADDGSMTADAVVYRAHQSEGAVVARYGDDWITVQPDRSSVCQPGQAVVYANDRVQYCRSTGV